MGYWSNHKYKRRSVTKDSELGFLGWDWIENQLDKFTGQKRLRNRALFLTIFKTGGRINEVLSLKRSNFTHDEISIIVRNMMKEKDKDRETYRDIKIPKAEPLNKEWVNWINQFNKDQYIFLSPKYDYVKGDIVQPHLSYIRAYQIISKIGIYPHFIRSQKASMLKSYYKVSDSQLQTLMQWKTFDMVRVYATQELKEEAEEQMLEKFKN